MRTTFMHLVKMFWPAMLFCFDDAVFAHDPGLSTLTVKLGGTHVEVFATFARKEIEALLLADASSEGALQELASHAVAVSHGGRAVPLIGQVARFDKDNADFRLTFAAEPNQKIVLHSLLLGRLPPGHRQLLAVTDLAGATVKSRLLSARDNYAELEIRPSAGPTERTTSGGGWLLLGGERWVPALLILVALAGGYWLIRRICCHAGSGRPSVPILLLIILLLPLLSCETLLIGPSPLCV